MLRQSHSYWYPSFLMITVIDSKHGGWNLPHFILCIHLNRDDRLRALCRPKFIIQSFYRVRIYHLIIISQLVYMSFDCSYCIHILMNPHQNICCRIYGYSIQDTFFCKTSVYIKLHLFCIVIIGNCYMMPAIQRNRLIVTHSVRPIQITSIFSVCVQIENRSAIRSCIGCVGCLLKQVNFISVQNAVVILHPGTKGKIIRR